MQQFSKLYWLGRCQGERKNTELPTFTCRFFEFCPSMRHPWHVTGNMTMKLAEWFGFFTLIDTGRVIYSAHTYWINYSVGTCLSVGTVAVGMKVIAAFPVSL